MGEGYVDKTVGYNFPLDETLGIGRDGATPVTDDYPMVDNAFNGKVYSVTVDIEAKPTAYYEPPENIWRRVMTCQ